MSKRDFAGSEDSLPETFIPEGVAAEILSALRRIRFGSVEVTVHDSRVVQIESKEKRRFMSPNEIRRQTPTQTRAAKV